MREALVTAEVELEVPFQDIDAMQVVWHGNYFRYFESARAALLRRIDYDYPQMLASQYLWPIIELHARFPKPLHYAQRIRVQAALLEWENRLKIGYRVTDAASGQRLSNGYTIQCAVDARSGELQLVSPAVLRERLKEFL
ncbi:MAG: acyl-CoA thioesterase [Gammaproteobacteria bacterium]|nr:acyl-CoA thioesterase [Gammaproteobacteria bacterium]MDE1983229.1 acyl-CoA thioesterase [Gammaproteobacteria bacterium]MDE2108976.1 acyl-CoA thioesterase [Gammaproteobacteria bacterium]MDE2459770.1 acyl-CoA thioesterase [Gammaproteobacteria bacterium]